MDFHMRVIHARNGMIESIILGLLKLNQLPNGSFGLVEIGVFSIQIVCGSHSAISYQTVIIKRPSVEIYRPKLRESEECQ
jgi:hypothetical protein